VEQAELASASSWLHWLSLIKYIGGVMVVVGVAAELLGDWFSEPLQKKLDDFRKLEIAQLTTEGQRLSKDAETARASIAAANERAAQSEKAAAEAKLELEKFKAPRKLDSHILAIAERLKKFPDARFDTSVVPGDPEAFTFMAAIAATLESAGWTWVDWNPTGALGGTFTILGKPNVGNFAFFDVMLQVNPESKSKLFEAANVLGGLLNAVGFAATLNVIDNASIPNKDTIHVLVGKKRT
jgi:hypothetical protein